MTKGKPSIEARAARRERIRAGLEQPPSHGPSGYGHGCLCAVCSGSQRASNKRGRRKRSMLPADRIPHGEKYLLQAVITDISERTRAETELKRALERERELNQLKSNFVSMVSHEFRTPLGIIQSSAEILDDYLDQLEPGERAEQLQSIIKNSRRMAGLMEDVLLLGRLDAGRMVFVPRPLRCVVAPMASR